ncbi:MAG: TRAP transporter small permease [Burkholderiales bacterium]|nr:MAG: TRAP transporter small permease [Burkholderiales bacterium]
MIEKSIRAIERVFATLAGFALLGIMGVVCIDVMMRYAFNAPLGWVYDLVSLYVLATVFYLSVSRTFAADEHVRIDVLVRRFGPRAVRWLERIHLSCALPVFVAIAWLAVQEAVSAYAQDMVLSGPIPWPSWPTPALVAIGTTMLALRLLLALGHRRGDPGRGDASGRDDASGRASASGR